MSSRPRRADIPGRVPTPAQVRALRESLGLSQTAFALRLGKSLRTVQNMEDGSVDTHPALWRYAQAVCSTAAEEWIERTHPKGWIHGGERKLTWEVEQLLLEAYRAGQLASPRS